MCKEVGRSHMHEGVVRVAVWGRVCAGDSGRSASTARSRQGHGLAPGRGPGVEDPCSKLQHKLLDFFSHKPSISNINVSVCKQRIPDRSVGLMLYQCPTVSWP